MKRVLPPRPRVLIVEDDADSAEGFALVLERASYETTVVASAAEAIGILRQATTRPDVVLLDLTLQDLGGAALVKALKQEQPLPPVIVISAAPERTLQTAAMELHAQGALRKPFGTEALVLAVQRAAAAAAVEP